MNFHRTFFELVLLERVQRVILPLTDFTGGKSDEWERLSALNRF